MSLTDLSIKTQNDLRMAGLGPATPTSFQLDFLGSPQTPWQLKSITGNVTAGAAIVIFGAGVYDENNNQVLLIPFVPWIITGTTNLVTSQQGPDVSAVQFFQILITGIPSDFYIFSNWRIDIVMLNNLPGSSYDVNAIFMQGYFRDKYRLSD